MGFNKPSWTPGHERRGIPHDRFQRLQELRDRGEQRARDKLAARALQGSLISLAALLGSDVTDAAGGSVGKLRDVVVHWTKGAPYPRMTAVLIRSGKSDVSVGARWVELSPPSSVRLISTKAYAAAVERHPADVALAHDVLDRQVVDRAGTQIVRPADLYLATVRDGVELVGIEVGTGALIRRLGPRRLRSRIRPAKVIDWASVGSFAPAREEGDVTRGRRSDIAGEPGAGLALEAAAGDVEELRASDVEAALREGQTEPDGGG